MRVRFEVLKRILEVLGEALGARIGPETHVLAGEFCENVKEAKWERVR